MSHYRELIKTVRQTEVKVRGRIWKDLTRRSRSGVIGMIFARRLGAMVIFGVCLAAIPAAAQTPVKVSATVVEQHLLKRTKPVYPAVGRMASVQGVVVLKAVIGKDGRVSQLRYICGPPVLVKAAMKAVRKWRYRPFAVDGHAAIVSSFVTVPFFLSLPKAERPRDVQNALAYARQYVLCKSLLAAGKNSTASPVCSTLPGMVSAVPPGDYAVKQQAYRYAAQSAFVLGDYGKAIHLLQHQIAVEGSGPVPVDASSGYAYWHLAMAYKGEGDLKNAQSNYKRAIVILKRGSHSVSDWPYRKGYAALLFKVLRQDAVVLRKLGKPGDAAKTTGEASKEAKRIRK